MIIDIHTHPGFIQEISGDPKQIAFRRENMFLYKQHIWPLELFLKQMDAAGIDCSVLLPEDMTTRAGNAVVTNDEIAALVSLCPDRLIGFASVDPHRDDALEVLERAFSEQKLMGLKLNPSSQGFMPTDPIMKPIYETCIRYNKPILFHAGMTWIKNSSSKYSRPTVFEDVALDYPEMRICLAHFGWPWVMETAMLTLKYPNVYADTALLYFDSPKQFFRTTFNQQLGEYWIDRMLYDKVMFGSNYPRIEQKRMINAVNELTLRPKQKQMVLGGNAARFIGLEG